MRSIYLLLIIDIILTVAAQLSLRTGALRFGTQELSISLLLEPFKNIFLFLGLILYGASFFLYFFILSKIQLSVVYPIAAGSVLAIVSVAAHFIFKEMLTGVQVVGIFAILIGIILVLLPT